MSRREQIVNDLNKEYVSRVGSNSIKKTYHDMVDSLSYRLLALYTYSKDPEPLRKRVKQTECPVETDVIKIK